MDESHQATFWKLPTLNPIQNIKDLTECLREIVIDIKETKMSKDDPFPSPAAQIGKTKCLKFLEVFILSNIADMRTLTIHFSKFLTKSADQQHSRASIFIEHLSMVASNYTS